MNRWVVAKACLYLVAAGSVVTGLVYMFHGSPMPYHLDGMRVVWSELPPGQRVVITAIQRGAASGMLAAGIAIATLTYFALGTSAWRWAGWCILLVGAIEILPTIHSVWQVRTQTPGDPPLAPLLVAVVLLVVGVWCGRTTSTRGGRARTDS